MIRTTELLGSRQKKKIKYFLSFHGLMKGQKSKYVNANELKKIDILKLIII